MKVNTKVRAGRPPACAPAYDELGVITAGSVLAGSTDLHADQSAAARLIDAQSFRLTGEHHEGQYQDSRRPSACLPPHRRRTIKDQQQGPRSRPASCGPTESTLVRWTTHQRRQHGIQPTYRRVIMKIKTKVRAGRPPACGATPPLMDGATEHVDSKEPSGKSLPRFVPGASQAASRSRPTTSRRSSPERQDNSSSNTLENHHEGQYQDSGGSPASLRSDWRRWRRRPSAAGRNSAGSLSDSSSNYSLENHHEGRYQDSGGSPASLRSDWRRWHCPSVAGRSHTEPALKRLRAINPLTGESHEG